MLKKAGKFYEGLKFISIRRKSDDIRVVYARLLIRSDNVCDMRTN